MRLGRKSRWGSGTHSPAGSVREDQAAAEELTYKRPEYQARFQKRGMITEKKGQLLLGGGNSFKRLLKVKKTVSQKGKIVCGRERTVHRWGEKRYPRGSFSLGERGV